MTTQFKPDTKGRGIEWCDRTVNPIGGCDHGCRWQMPDGTVAICYAEELAEKGVAKANYPNGFDHHYWRPNALRQLRGGPLPELIFIDSMSDLFGAQVPAEQIRLVLRTLREFPGHAYLSLTKSAPRVLKFLDDLPPNLWVGVSSPPDWMYKKPLSIVQQEAMLRKSLQVLETVRRETGNLVWMSAEPVSWDLDPVMRGESSLDWIVIGAASHGARYFMPDRDHIAKLLGQMDVRGTPVFFKGNIGKLIREDGLLGRWREDFPRFYRNRIRGASAWRYDNGALIPAVKRRQDLCASFGWTSSK